MNEDAFWKTRLLAHISGAARLLGYRLIPIAEKSASDPSGPDQAALAPGASPAVRLASAKAWIRGSIIRHKSLGDDLASYGAWDILLTLYVAAQEHRALSVTGACYAGLIPVTSGIRLITAMEDADWVARIVDPDDRRRTLVRLTAAGSSRIEQALDAAIASNRSLGLGRLQFVE